MLEYLTFFASHVYSTAPEARAKLKIDLDFIGGNLARGAEISITNEAYVKFLIDAGTKGKMKVGASSALQFYIIRGGGEGFLPADMRGIDASNVTTSATSTSGVTSVDSVFDYNDLMVVFDKTARLISAARLERPLMLAGRWSKRTANKVYESWANRDVFVYRNNSYSVEYIGLGVRDPFRDRKPGTGRVTIDLHKQEYTNGCIFIVDRATPALGDDAALGAFEPQLIKDVLKQSGIDINAVKGSKTLGRIRLVTIK